MRSWSWGPRQAGKSTWVRKILTHFEDPVLILHAEEPRIQELAHSPALALDALAGVLSPETLLLFEEIQHLAEAPLFIKGLVDLDRSRRIVATGSSSFAFSARTRESLAGRARRTQLLPLSLEEVAALIPACLAPAIREARLGELWERIVVTGGYPEPWFDPDPTTVLRYLVEAFVLKDTSDLHQIERPAVFRKLLELAAADIGNLVNLSDWAALAQASRNTVARYLEIAEEAHVLRLVPPFAGGKRAEITGTPKVFFLDNGLRNAVFGGFQPSPERADRGALWETPPSTSSPSVWTSSTKSASGARKAAAKSISWCGAETGWWQSRSRRQGSPGRSCHAEPTASSKPIGRPLWEWLTPPCGSTRSRTECPFDSYGPGSWTWSWPISKIE